MEDSETELLEVQRDISTALNKGCLPIAKLCSNAWELNDALEIKLDDSDPKSLAYDGFHAET